MHVLDPHGLPIGEIIVCDTMEEVQRCMDHYLPWVKRPSPKVSDARILKILVFNKIGKLFPYFVQKKDTLAGEIKLHVPVVVHGNLEEEVREGGSAGDSMNTEAWMAEEQEVFSRDSYRYSLGGTAFDGQLEEDESIEWTDVDLTTLEDNGYLTIDVAQLMDAGLLPKFMQDLGEAIRANLTSYTWVDRYSRKLGCCLGEYQVSDERPNLIVLDISGSIPRGVAYTMVGLIDTLRLQANADLIVNSGSSQWWPHDEPIDLAEINKIIGGCNEARQFYAILREHVLGRKWGNVIGFGDWDSPARKWIRGDDPDIIPSEEEFKSTTIGHVVSYHTCDSNSIAGYISWVRDCQVEDGIEPQPKSWVKLMKRW